MGVHHETGGSPEGLALVKQWSQQGEKFRDGEIECKWRGFTSNSGVTLGTVVHMAREAGWQENSSADPESEAGLTDQVPWGDVNQRATIATSEAQSSRLLVRAGDIPLAPPAFVIDGLLERESVSMIFGKSFGGKTFIALDMGLSCASGKDFYGHSISQSSPVIYEVAEGKNGLMRRCYAWCKKNECDLAALPFFVTSMSVSISDPKMMEKFVKEIDDISKTGETPSLIVFDTLNRSVAGWSENSADDMRKLLKQLEYLAKRYFCNVCLVHHSGHEAEHRGRGSSSLYAGMDQSFKVSSENGIVCLENDKMKDGEKPAPMFFSIQDVELEMAGFKAGSAVLVETVGRSFAQTGVVAQLCLPRIHIVNPCG